MIKKYQVYNMDDIPVCIIDMLQGMIYVNEDEIDMQVSRFDPEDQKGQIVKALFFSDQKSVYENSDAFTSTRAVLQTRMNELFGPQKSAHILKTGNHPVIKARHFMIGKEDRFGYVFLGRIEKMSASNQNSYDGVNVTGKRTDLDYIYNHAFDFRTIMNDAEVGSAESMFMMGLMYYYGMTDGGYCRERDLSKARQWMERAVSADCSHKGRALRLIGHCYYSGHGPMGEQSYEKCVQYHERAKDEAEDGDFAHLACMFSKGLGCDLNIDKAEALYKEEINRSHELDSRLAILFGKMCEQYGQFEQAAEVYERVKDHPEAAIALAKLYILGVHKGLEKPAPDFLKARETLEGALQNDVFGAEANYLLGMLYFQPTHGFPLDFGKAVRYFHRAADDGGHREAMYCLGYMYMHGFPGVGRDYKKAVCYYEESYKLGSISGLVDLAFLYQQHEVLDYEKAFYYATAGTRLGIKEAEFVRANLLRLGRGCQKDLIEAERLYRHLAESGFADAQFIIDRISRMGKAEEG